MQKNSSRCFRGIIAVAMFALPGFLNAASQAQPPQDEKTPSTEKAAARPASDAELEAARQKVSEFRQAFRVLSEKQGLAIATEWMYAPDFVFVTADGVTTNKKEYIAGRQTTPQERKEELDAEGGKTLPIAEKDRYWKPERYEINGKDEIIVYSYPVSKQRQRLPVRADGSATRLADVKLVIAQKEVFVRQGNLLHLKRLEMLSVKMYVNGKPQPKEVLEGKQLPNF